MRLKRIEASEFCQHVSLDLDMAAIEQAVIVGENGAGKSTLMDMVVWCLYGRGTDRSSSTDDLIQDDRFGMWVKTTWDHDGHEAVVQRSRSIETKAGESSLNVWYDGTASTMHTIAETQSLVEDWFGLNREQLLAGPFMEQGEQDLLMRLDPGPRKALFASLCGADRFEAAHETVKQWASGLTVELSRIDGQVPAVREVVDTELDVRRGLEEARAAARSSRSDVEALEERIEAQREEARVLHEQALRSEELGRDIDRLLRQVDAHQQEIGRLRQLIETKGSLEAPAEPEYTTLPPELEDDIETLEAEAERYREAARSLDRARHFVEVHEAARAKADAEDLCDRCPYREDTDQEAHAENLRSIVELERYLQEHEGADRAAADRAAMIRGRERERADADRDNEIKRVRFEAASAEYQGARQSIEEARSAIADLEARCTGIGDDVSERTAERLRLLQSDDRAKELAERMRQDAAALTAARSASTAAERQLALGDAALAEVVKAKEKLADLDTQRSRTAEALEAHRLAERMLHRNGLPTMIIEATAPLVEQRANELLDRMPGGISVGIVTQKRTKAGKWRDTFDIEVEEAGRRRPYGMLSGAERFRVDLSIRLGLASVLLHQTGTKFETLWLDEPFAAQDRGALESLLQSVAAVTDDFGLSLVVTHQPEVAERFPVRIEVSQSPTGTAHVEVGQA